MNCQAAQSVFRAPAEKGSTPGLLSRGLWVQAPPRPPFRITRLYVVYVGSKNFLWGKMGEPPWISCPHTALPQLAAWLRVWHGYRMIRGLPICQPGHESVPEVAQPAFNFCQLPANSPRDLPASDMLCPEPLIIREHRETCIQLLFQLFAVIALRVEQGESAG